jgi:hypothetical protein
MGIEQAFSRPGTAAAGKKTGVNFVHARRPSKEEDETVKPVALPDLTSLICKTDARKAFQANQKVSDEASDLHAQERPQIARPAAKPHQFETGKVFDATRVIEMTVPCHRVSAR